uniref:t-SNARE coiled-coil homology domain-containing protein n=1 Tax=Parastrongyloides trichosuri TaxID=131310 RepID=A0A0N4Z215_PARTI
MKNRLQELHEILEYLPSTSNSLVESPTKTLINDDNDLNEFLNTLNNIKIYIERMEKLLEICVKKQNEILIKPGINEFFDDVLKNANSEFKDLTRICMNQIRIWNNESKKWGKKTLSINERIKINQISFVNRKIEKILLDYNESNIDYREKLTKKVAKYLDFLNVDICEKDIEDFMISGNLGKISESIVMGKNVKDEIIQSLQVRNEGILNLEKQIKELHEMFHDVMLLTELQNNNIDCIYKSMESATNYVNEAKTNMKEANEKKKKMIKVS